MIEKMSFVNIIGPKDKIDDVAKKYITKYDIQLENALSELKTTENLIPFNDINPYKEYIGRAKKFLPFIDNAESIPPQAMDFEEASSFIKALHHDFKKIEVQKNSLQKELDELQNKLDQISNFKGLDVDIKEVLSYKFIRFRFGRIPKDYYYKLEKFFYDDSDAIFLASDSDNGYVYGVYFASSCNIHEADAAFASFHFERIFIPDYYTGTPRQACANLEAALKEKNNEIEKINSNIKADFKEKAAAILGAYKLFESLSTNFDIRNLAAVTDKSEPFFILCGWMTLNDALSLKKDLENASDASLIIEDDKDSQFSKPPTKLKNPKILKPFEMFINMYGLPSYNEFDPTWFIAITYSFIFGVMFGDVGQGLVLVLSGFLLYKIKHINLCAIIGTAGIFSTFFGFMFGSVFGFEDVIKAHWLRPIESMTKLPFVGTLNTVFIITIAFGMFMVLVSMILHIYNGIKAGKKANALFDANGIAGFIFYGIIVLVIILFMKGKPLPAGIILAILLGIPLLLIIFKEPLENIIENKKEVLSESKGMFITQAFFEIFEMLLGLFSNTLSFVRIGAFAVSHAAMMEVVMMLAGAEKGSPNILGIILGNIFVIGMEGLIVGIQVLRLEYYEMFSRFYEGGGREFKPFGKTEKKN